jgi:hypothetical protein
MLDRSTSENTRTSAFAARHMARDGMVGAVFGLALAAWEVAADPAIHEMTTTRVTSIEPLLTALFVIVALFAVGAALSGVVLRMFSEFE